LFTQLELERPLDHRLGDIRDAALLNELVAETRPELVLHLAAQPLVRRSYAEPTATRATNVMGTIQLLEALRRLEDPARRC
jgi:CDP-glucose 4,6-dehydratase